MLILVVGSQAKPAESTNGGKTYTLAELRKKPEGLDDKKLESYLSATAFKAAFRLEKAQFYKLPTWKQDEMKKKLGLY